MTFKVKPSISEADINTLFKVVWDNKPAHDYIQVLEHSLSYICAYQDDRFVGFVNLAWDGGIHAFILDTTVHPNFQKQGIGTELVKRAIQEARAANCDWVHVDYEAHLAGFYKSCGFRASQAAVLELS